MRESNFMTGRIIGGSQIPKMDRHIVSGITHKITPGGANECQKTADV